MNCPRCRGDKRIACAYDHRSHDANITQGVMPPPSAAWLREFGQPPLREGDGYYMATCPNCHGVGTVKSEPEIPDFLQLEPKQHTPALELS